MDKYLALKQLVLDTEKDAEKFYQKGNASAGARIRKNMQELRKLAVDIRKEVSELKAKEVVAA